MSPEGITARGYAAGKKSYEALFKYLPLREFGVSEVEFLTYISQSYGYDPGGIVVAL
jgi:hypothetical protein